MTTQITAEDLDNLRHMLGIDPRRYTPRQFGFRNYYASSKTGRPFASMRRLKSAGFVRQGRVSDSMIFFHATEEGCKAVGLNAEQIKRALEPS
jgi:hypothetical protein